MRPKFAKVGLGYAVTVADLMTELSVGRLTTSRGEIHAELTVTCAMPGIGSADGHVFRGRINLSAPRSRSELSKYLEGRTQGSLIDWRELLETLCVRVLEAESKGTEFVKIGRLPDQIGPAFQLDPLLPLEKPTILFGDGGVGKSYMAVGVAVSVSTGATVLPGFHPRRCPVLYLDWETDQHDIDGRIKAVAAGVDIEAPQIDYRPSAAPLASQVEEIARHIAQEHIGLVIVDSMAGALGVSSEVGDANESVVRMFTALRHIGATVLVIDHVSKEGAANEGGAFKPYGSAYKVNLARSVWELRRGKDSEGEVVHLGLYHRKSNNSRLTPPIGLAYRNQDGKVVTWDEEPITEADLAAGVSLARRVHEALTEGPKFDQEMADAFNVDVTKVRVPLSRGKKTGQYTKLPSGKWALAYAGSDAMRTGSERSIS